MHSLRGRHHVIDLRNIGLVGAVEMESRPDKAGARGYDVFVECFKRGVLVRQTGDIIALSPPLIIEKAHIDQAIDVLGDVIGLVE